MNSLLSPLCFVDALLVEDSLPLLSMKTSSGRSAVTVEFKFGLAASLGSRCHVGHSRIHRSWTSGCLT